MLNLFSLAVIHLSSALPSLIFSPSAPLKSFAKPISCLLVPGLATGAPFLPPATQSLYNSVCCLNVRDGVPSDRVTPSSAAAAIISFNEFLNVVTLGRPPPSPPIVLAVISRLRAR